jgi:hypothetical protein
MIYPVAGWMTRLHLGSVGDRSNRAAIDRNAAEQELREAQLVEDAGDRVRRQLRPVPLPRLPRLRHAVEHRDVERR